MGLLLLRLASSGSMNAGNTSASKIKRKEKRKTRVE